MDDLLLGRLVDGQQADQSTERVGPFGAVALLDLVEEVADVESFCSGELVESPQQILELTQLFDVARTKALSQDDSLTLIRKYMEEGYR